ncbi:unnamed protein product [Callosobruchus maculatus]|uniref:Uncharacterized protein n=1 Tax=Callosobruchus maculatus TaxID=64391 RepID=A0A653DB30_CALMS|nr:unnamed protein product [Callosobruchus maculatus]
MRVAVALVLLGLAVLADIQLTSCFKLASHDIKQFEAENLGSSSSLSSSSSNSHSRSHAGGRYESRSHERIRIRHHKVPCICDRHGRKYRNGELPLCNYRRCFWPWDRTTTEKSQSSQRAQTTEQSLPSTDGRSTKKSPSWPWDKTTPDSSASTHGPKTIKRPHLTKKDHCDDKHGCWPWHKKTTSAPKEPRSLSLQKVGKQQKNLSIQRLSLENDRGS